jgi:hypothetical protein
MRDSRWLGSSMTSGCAQQPQLPGPALAERAKCSACPSSCNSVLSRPAPVVVLLSLVVLTPPPPLLLLLLQKLAGSTMATAAC